MNHLWKTTLGMTITTKQLPHLPYAARGEDAIVHVWHERRWASRMFLVGNISALNPAGEAQFNFQSGGWQDGRGGDKGGGLYVENVFEELDAKGEWFYNTSTRTLYLYNNATDGVSPDGSTEAIADTSITLVNVTGTQAAPVVNISLLGIGFRVPRRRVYVHAPPWHALRGRLGVATPCRGDFGGHIIYHHRGLRVRAA
jgi:hypothetical protein